MESLIIKKRIMLILLLLTIIPLLSMLMSSWFFQVPSVWLFHFPFLQVFQKKTDVQVRPSVPVFLGQLVTVNVTDARNNTSIQDAKVTISKDGVLVLTLSTSEDGIVTFKYPAEVTVIIISKDSYTPAMKVIPRVPNHWFMAPLTGMIIGILVDIIVFFFLYKWKKKLARSNHSFQLIGVTYPMNSPFRAYQRRGNFKP